MLANQNAVQAQPTSVNTATHMASSIVANDVSITGNLVAKGTLQIDGEVKGDIKCDSLMIGETANIKGGVVAAKVVVSGKISGTIKGSHVELQPSSQVDGDILYTTIAIADGAVFEGGLKRSENPLAA